MRNHHYVHVVDDDEASRTSVAFLLRTLGLECFEYRSGRELLDGLTARPAGCVLLDLLMPDMNGLEIQKEMAARGLRWPVLFMSGHASTSAVVEAIGKGAVEFLLKPFGEEDLLVALHHGFALLNRQFEQPQIPALRA